jgi:hypothetical protein
MAPLATLAKKARFEVLSRGCEKRVVSRQWATWDIWSPEPYWFERHNYGRGRKLAAQPARSKDAHLYGYDASGVPARVRRWSGFLARWHEEELYVPEGNDLLRYRFRVDGTLLNLERFTYADGRLVHHEIWFAEAKRRATQTFVWKDGLLVKVDVKDWGPSFALAWTELGVLDAIYEVSKGRRHEVYRRPKQRETLPELFGVIRERLLAVVPRVIARTRPRSAAYAAMLVVDEEEWRHALPPSITIAFEDDRARLAVAYADRLASVLWSAPEHPTEVTLTDARLEAACKRANQIVWQTNAHAKVFELVREVARELQAIDWASQREVTEDFVVYATRLEGDGERDVRKVAPPAIKKRLVARGLL